MKCGTTFTMVTKVKLECPVCGSSFERYPSQLRTIGKVRVCSIPCRTVLWQRASAKARVESFEGRFWAKVEKTAGCWLWTGGTTSAGYGQIKLRGKSLQAHRVSYEFANSGPAPSNLFVLHSCDNRKCVNPKHLRLGTHKDNMEDAIDRNRFPKRFGESSAHCKLKDKDVLEIRALYKTGQCKQVELSEKFGVHQTYISKIVNGRIR